MSFPGQKERGKKLTGDRKVYEAAIRAGLNFAWEGKWQQALGAYQQALDEMPEDPVILNHLGLAYLELEQTEKALEAYRRASELAPGDPAPLSRIAAIHEQLGHPHAAAGAHYSIAQIRQRQRAWTQAIQSFQKTIQLQPGHLEAHRALAELLVQLDRPQRAAKQYLNLARALRQQGQLDRALDQ